MAEAVAAASNNGGGDVLHVMKESSDDGRHDYYALGRVRCGEEHMGAIGHGSDVGIGLRSTPRTVVLDHKTWSNLLQWPVEGGGTLRTNSTDLGRVTIDHGSVIPLSLHRATQLDIEALFRLDPLDVAAAKEADVG
ncbi:hypothetical protein ZWY2020_035792 [Hordeum vulgare]|nr:hypothetical protein ZWY2020_035792 [Hordeum vulgare]